MNPKRGVAALPVMTAVLGHIPCCGPVLLATLTAGTSGLSWLHQLEPYQPWLVGLSWLQVALLFGWAKWGPRRHCCSEHECQDSRNQYRTAWITLVLVCALTIVGLMLPRHTHTLLTAG